MKFLVLLVLVMFAVFFTGCYEINVKSHSHKKPVKNKVYSEYKPYYIPRHEVCFRNGSCYICKSKCWSE